MSDTKPAEHLDLVASIVAAYVENNTMRLDDMATLIASVSGALAGLGASPVEAAPVALLPAVPIKKSITPDAIICLDDGKPFKSLKRHLSSKYGITPDEYRAKWGLPHDYPMVAPNYSASRSALAKSVGLGQLSAKRAAPTKTPAKKASGRKAKGA